MLTVVLDDDPTGTQMATGVEVLLAWDATAIADVLTRSGAVYIQTNSRAVTADEAARLARELRADINTAAARLGEPVLVVLRGDSTLRGHVFVESDVFAGATGSVLFVPAFPQGGRTTVGSVHRIVVEGVSLPVADTEFARDPVFGFTSSHLVDWVAEQGGRRAVPVPLAALRTSGGAAVAAALAAAAPGEFVVPDAETDDDIRLIHHGLMDALRAGTHVVVRSAATLAALCAGRLSTSYLPRPLDIEGDGQVLVVCGSHTAAATRQLGRLCRDLGVEPVPIPTRHAFADPEAAGQQAARTALAALEHSRTVLLATERVRRGEDDTLTHGALVMRALVEAASTLIGRVRTVVSKGGITSAEVARVGFGARRATVRGQLAAGISVWDMGSSGTPGTQIVVPGNVGGPDTLVDAVHALRR